jgi:hypothetical protein
MCVVCDSATGFTENVFHFLEVKDQAVAERILPFFSVRKVEAPLARIEPYVPMMDHYSEFTDPEYLSLQGIFSDSR